MTTKLRKAVRDLGKYYGRVAVSPYRGLAASPGSAPTDDRLAVYLSTYVSAPDENDAIKNFMERITSRSQTMVGVQSILDNAAQNGDFHPPILVTPDERINPGSSMHVVNTSVDKKTRQGTLEPLNHKYYTMADACSKAAAADAGGPTVSVIQVFSPVNSISSADNDMAALYLNALSTLKASQAVPYMDIKIYAAEPLGTNVPTPAMSLGRFLGVRQREGLTPGTADYALANGAPLITNFRPDVGVDVNASGTPKEEIRIVSGIEMFTAPQTLVDAKRAYEDGIADGKVLDPFQPFMSVEGLKLNMTSPGGFISDRTGEISLILHDRARMDEVVALVSPHRMGKTRLVITWGYSHPAGQDPNSDDAVGNMIDSMRAAETFIVTSSNFSFAGPNVKISMRLAPIASKELRSINVLYAHDEGDSSDVKRDLESLNLALSNYNEGRQQKLSIPTVLRSYDNVSLNGLNAEERKAIRELAKNVRGSSGLGSLIEKLFGNGGAGGTVAAESKKRRAQLESIIDGMKSTPDPFLPRFSGQGEVSTEPHIWTGQKPGLGGSPYVSLGKVISTFVGGSLRSSKNQSLQPDDEVHFVFHPFNSEAAGMQDYNLAHFVIEYSELRRVLERKLSLSGSMPLANFLAVLKQHFVGDIGAMSYDLLSPRHRNIYKLDLDKGGRRAENDYYTVTVKPKQPTDDAQNNTGASSETPPPSPQKRKVKRPGFDSVFETDKQAQLAKLYGVPEGASVSFRPPNLTYVVETCPKSVDWNDDPERVRGFVVKIHVTDQSASHLSGLGDFIKAASDDLFVPLLRRRTDSEAFPYVSGHSTYSSGFMSRLAERQLVKPITLQELRSLNANEDLGIDESTFKTISENYVIFKPSGSSTFKEIVKSIYPTLTWGTESSGILAANLSVLDDSNLQSTMIIRASNYDETDLPDKDGVPLMVSPTTLSLETMGCPMLFFTQQFYIDFGTNTDADNVYAVTGIDHDIQPGKFRTSLKLVQLNAFGRFRTMKSDFQRTVLNAFLTRFNANKSGNTGK